MDLKTILEWSIAVLAVTGLVVYTRLRNKNRAKKTLAPLLSFAREYNAEISSHDTWENVLVGIQNKDGNSLFFIRHQPGGDIREKINLSEVSNCRMYKAERKLMYKKELENVIDRIELNFSFYDHRPELSLQFYNVEFDRLTLTDELQLSQKWLGIIKSVISTNPIRLKPNHRKAKTA